MNDTRRFLDAKTYAIAGVSKNRAKYGNKVFVALLRSNREAYPINPAAREIEGHTVYARLQDIPVVPESLSIITPPLVTRQIVADAIAVGVKNVWMQPGAEDAHASKAAREAGLNVIDDGSCILVHLALQR
jgi:uncharacterized protein